MGTPDPGPAGIVNRAFDLIGRSDLALGELAEGTDGARVALRAYLPALKQLLRAAPWVFARKMAPLTLLADATGQTPNVYTVVQAPYSYAYELPIDCLKARFLPWNSNPVQPNPPLMTNLSQPPLTSIRLQPAPFLVSLDYNYPVVIGQPATWDQVPEWWNTSGEGPVQRTVILTNVPPQTQTDQPTIYPSLVYTCLVVYPSQWDSLFEEAFVNFLSQKLAMALIEDKRHAVTVRNQCIQVTKDIVSEARAASGNETGYPITTTREASWIKFRNVGGGSSGFGTWGMGGLGPSGWQGAGCLYSGFDSLSFDGGAVY